MTLARRPPFPGMDPWLEHPSLWPDVHNSLIVAIRDALAPRLAPRYLVRIETRITLLAIGEAERFMRPDVTIWRGLEESRALSGARSTTAVVEADVNLIDIKVPMEDEIEETFLEIREVATQKLVTVIEVLSPTNKLAHDGCNLYTAKRRAPLRTPTNLVEIDLLRAGEPMSSEPAAPPDCYHILVSRARTRPTARLYVFTYKDPIPTIPIPLLPEDEEPPLELNAIAHALFDRAYYFQSIDYAQPPDPPLPDHDAEWASPFIEEAMHAPQHTPEGPR